MGGRKEQVLHINAPLVQVLTKQGRVINLSRGDVVTEDVADESVELLLELGFATADDVDTVPEANVPPDPDPSPPPPAAIEKPARNANLESWQAYARAQGMSDADLDGKSRDDLRDLYKS